MREDGGGVSDQAASYLATLLTEAEDLLERGDAAEAVALLERSLAQAKAALALEPQGAICAALGDVHRRTGDLERALACYEQAAQALREAGDTAAEAGALLKCGDAQRALRRVGAATQSYAAASAIYHLLDDPRGAAHGEFLLAELAAGVNNREIAGKHYTRAIELYREAAEREGVEVDEDIEVPATVPDPRLTASAHMAVIALTQLERLPEAPPRDPESPSSWTPPTAAPAPAAEVPSAPRPPQPAPTPAPAPATAEGPSALLLGTLAVGVCGLLLLAVQWIERAPWVSVGAGVLALTFAWLAIRRSTALSPYLGYSAAGVAWLLLLASGARPLLSQPETTKPKLLPTATPVVRAVQDELWTPENQRAAFTRELGAVAGDPRREADVLYRHGEFECYQGERRRCRELWQQSLARLEAAGAPGLAADMAMRVGDLHMRGGRPAPARELFAAAAARYAEARRSREETQALQRLGDAHAALEQWPAAIAAYREALRELRQQHDGVGEIRILLRLAAIEQRIGSPERTRKLLYRALRLSVSNSRLHARVWLALAEFEVQQEVEVAAVRAYDRAVSLAGAERDSELEARGLRRWAGYERARGRIAAARDRYEVARRLARSREAYRAEAFSLLRAAELEAQAGDVLAARDYYAAAAALFAKQPGSTGVARVALGIGDLRAQYGDRDGAREEYAQAIEYAARADHTGLQLAAIERLTSLLGDTPQAASVWAERAALLRTEAYGRAG